MLLAIHIIPAWIEWAVDGPLFALLILLYLAPGLLAVLVLKPVERAHVWFALAAPVSVAIQIGLECLLKIFTDEPPRRLATAAAAIALFIIAVIRKRSPPLRNPADRRTALLVLLVPVGFALAFPSATFSREPTSDGLEATEMARSLDTHFLPRWPTESGLKGFGQGLIALAYPNAWFRGRVSFLMFLGVIVAQVLALVEARQQRRMGWIGAGAISLTVLAAGSTLGLHVGFEPYHSDLANPGGAELMAVAMMLGAFVALVERRTAVFLIAIVLAHATLPSGLLFAIVLGAAWFLITRSRSALWRFGGAIGLCVLVTLLYEKVYVPAVLPPGTTMDAGSESLASRVRLLIFTDVMRFAFLLIPCGIVPFFFLFAWKKHDAIASVATLVTGAVFLFFFVLATYSPHYFAPTMVLALVPYWRWARTPKAVWIGFAGAVAGLALSLPPFHEIPEPYDHVGWKISIYAGPDQNEPYHVGDVLQTLAYLPWDEIDASKALVATGPELVQGSRRVDIKARGLFTSTDWMVLSDSAPTNPFVPKDYQPVISRGGWTLFARPGVKLEDVKERGFRTDFQAPWYRVPKEALFRGLTLKSGRYDLDLKKLFGRK